MKRLVLFILISSLVIADDFEDYKKIHQISYKKYEENLEKEFNLYKEKILTKWVVPETFTKKSWVEYSEDYNKKLVVDYENNSIKTEIIVDKDTKSEVLKKELYSNIETILSRTTAEAAETLPIKELKNGINRSNETLVGDIYDIKERKNNLTKKSKELVDGNQIRYSKAKEEGKKIVSIEIPFPKDGLSKKAKIYEKTVNENSKKSSLPSSLIYSIIECESSFNPMAISPIPAYGLMQIVPNSAGKDITKRIEGKERILSPRELYDGNKNIEYGSTYLKILYYSYLKSINDKRSRLYCTIAAYNTGAGNLSKTFIGNTNINKASKVINKMNSEEVYKKLLKDLPYEETKKYLKKVRLTQKKYR